MNIHCFGLSLAWPVCFDWLCDLYHTCFVSCFLPSPLPPSSLTSTQFSVETQVYETVIKMNTLVLQLVWNRLSAQASSPSLALALHRRIVSLGILSRWPMQRGARAGQLHRLWHSHPLHTGPQSGPDFHHCYCLPHTLQSSNTSVSVPSERPDTCTPFLPTTTPSPIPSTTTPSPIPTTTPSTTTPSPIPTIIPSPSPSLPPPPILLLPLPFSLPPPPPPSQPKTMSHHEPRTAGTSIPVLITRLSGPVDPSLAGSGGTAVIASLGGEKWGNMGGMNTSNLTRISCQPHLQELSQRFKVLYLNAQSCRNKTTELSDLTDESNADLVFLTETWLKAVGDEVKLQELIPPGFVTHSCPRKGRPAGGIAVLYCDTLHNCVTISSKEHGAESFESCETQVNYNDQSLTVLCLNRPPPSKKNQLKTTQFMT